MSQSVSVPRPRRRISVRAIAVCAMLSAVAFVLMLMDFPVPFLIPDFVKMAEAFGAEGIRVERPGEIRDALIHARDCGRSCIVEIMCDPNEHVLPMVPADPNAAMVMGRCAYRC